MAGPHAAARRASSHRTAHHCGFTTVELIIVIVLVGILSAVAMPRFFDRAVFDASAWAEQVKSMLRQAQKIAVAQNRPVFVLLTPGRVALCFSAQGQCPQVEQVPAPGGANSNLAETRAACGSDTWMCEAPPAGLVMTVPAAAIRFDGLGRARVGNADSGRFALTVEGQDLVRSIGIEAETGYVD